MNCNCSESALEREKRCFGLRNGPSYVDGAGLSRTQAWRQCTNDSFLFCKMRFRSVLQVVILDVLHGSEILEVINIHLGGVSSSLQQYNWPVRSILGTSLKGSDWN